MYNIYYVYKDLFDKKIENSTIVVILIALMILGVSSVFSPNNTSLVYTKSNVIESENIVTIEGKEYRLVLND